MIIKTALSLIMAILIYFICSFFRVNFAFLWAFLTFILNFIPSVGSIAATILPTLMSFVQFEDTQIVVLILLTITFIHFAIGNILEPIIMGDKLKLNTLTVIFSLVFWGYLWGIPGMILSVPLMVIIKLIFEQFPSLEIVSRILGKTIKI
jgi:predicted PurR-regulated permease PerM